MQRREMLKLVGLALGAGLSGSLSSRVLGGDLPTASASRTLFSNEMQKMLAALTEMIIPKTDTPGAIEAGVPKVVEMMVADWYTDTERKIFFDGLISLDMFCSEKFKKIFNRCEPMQQIEALKATEKDAAQYKSTVSLLPFEREIDENTPFFTKLKELTVLGYYTSEVGAKQELAYNPMPMRYEGDYDFIKIGRQWSW